MDQHCHLFPAHRHQYASHSDAYLPEFVLLYGVTWILTCQWRYKVASGGCPKNDEVLHTDGGADDALKSVWGFLQAWENYIPQHAVLLTNIRIPLHGECTFWKIYSMHPCVPQFGDFLFSDQVTTFNRTDHYILEFGACLQYIMTICFMYLAVESFCNVGPLGWQPNEIFKSTVTWWEDRKPNLFPSD